MTISIQSPYLQFTLDPDASTWSLHGTHTDSPFLEDVWMQVKYHMGLSSLWRNRTRKFQFLDKWGKPRIIGPEPLPSVHGDLIQLVVEIGPDVNGILYRLVFALSEREPLFFWHLDISNEGRHPVYMDKIEMLRAGFFPRRQLLPDPGPLSILVRTKPVGYGAIRPSPEQGELGFFSNGWQSWSHTGAYGPEDYYRGSRLGLFAAAMWYPNGKSPSRVPGLFTSTMFGVVGDRTHRSAILLGFASQVQHFGSLEAYIADPLYPAVRLYADGDGARLDPGAKLSTDWAVATFLDIDDPDPLAPYLESVSRQNRLPLTIQKRPSTTGWCSWYQYFQDIDQEKISRNLEAAKELQEPAESSGQVVPLDIFQIDDGYEAQIGDWYDFRPGFPAGVAPLAREIAGAGFTPGLWLAPFIAHTRSKFARNHRDWLLRNRLNLPVNAGFVWNNFNKAIDLTHPEALSSVSDLIHTAVHEWGFPYLKLDFLYAAALKGRYRDRTKTRAQVLRSGLDAIRAAAGPEVTLLGCGVPIGPSIGIFDSMRVGADVAPTWGPQFMPPQAMFHPEPNMPSTRNALQNILTRSFAHQRWWVNDPDCLLLRPDSGLTLAEVQTLATAIALTGGSLLLSDDLAKLPHRRLRIAEQLLPLMDRRPRVLDWFDSPIPHLLRLDFENITGNWVLLAVFNWDDVPKDYTLHLHKCGLQPGNYFTREFWSGVIGRIQGEYLSLKDIPAHGVKLLALRSFCEDPLLDDPGSCVCYLGSDLHISQGLEVTALDSPGEDRLQIELDRPGTVQGMVDLYLPGTPGELTMDSGEVRWNQIGDSCYRFHLEFHQHTVLDLSWNLSGS